VLDLGMALLTASRSAVADIPTGELAQKPDVRTGCAYKGLGVLDGHGAKRVDP
jgi:hypothetical protein